MYHSITFIKSGRLISSQGYISETKRNTWDDWHLIPTSRPVFNPPTVKTKYIDIPGADGIIDLTESLTGFPSYNNREGSIEFIVENGHKQWYNTYSEIMDYLHGQYVKAILEDDPSHYYEGRFAVNQWKSDSHWSLITFDYNLNPYKMSVSTSTEDWEWNPFDFENGVIQTDCFKDVAIDSDSYVSYGYSSNGLIGRKPVCPTFTVSSTDGNGMVIKLYNRELNILLDKVFPDGSTQDPEYILSNISSNNILIVSFKGHGTVSVDFRSGGF